MFEVSGTIVMTANLKVSNPYLTIAGQTAPSPGITLRGGGLIVVTHDVLVQHLRVRVGDGSSGPTCDNRDALAIEDANSTGKVKNVVIDHCSLTWSTDEVQSSWHKPTSDYTVSNSILAEALNCSCHPKGCHGYGPIIGNGIRNAALLRNLMAHNAERNPLLVSGATGVIVNNVIYNYGKRATHVDAEFSAVQAAVVGNAYVRGPSTGSNRPLFINPVTNPSSIFYLADNSLQGNVPADQWTLVEDSRGMVRATTWPLTPRPLAVLPNPQVLDWVLANAGARPADRDSVDARIIQDARTGGGRIINSQSDVGGWPALAVNVRGLTLPNNPSGDDDGDGDGDGYTNLEEWLHSFSRAVEGSASARPTCAEAGGTCCGAAQSCGGQAVSASDCAGVCCLNSTCAVPPTQFSDIVGFGDRADYHELTASRWSVVEDGGDLRYFLNTSDYEGVDSALGEYALSTAGPFGDFDLSLRIKSAEDLTANAGADICLVYGFEDAANYSYLMLNHAAALNQLFRMVDGVREPVADIGQALITDNGYHTVQLSRRGTEVVLQLDGQERLRASDALAGPGMVGVGSLNDSAYFDDISLVGPASSGQSDGLSGQIAPPNETLDPGEPGGSGGAGDPREITAGCSGCQTSGAETPGALTALAILLFALSRRRQRGVRL